MPLPAVITVTPPPLSEIDALAWLLTLFCASTAPML